MSDSGIDEKIILKMGTALIDDCIRNILFLPFCQYHFVRIPFCPRTPPSCCQRRCPIIM